MIERNITKDLIQKIINNPTETIYDSDRQNYKSFAIVDESIIDGQPYLMVIYNKFNTKIVIITSMYTDKGGLRAVGFSKIR